ncbi:MAG: helix-turn-helix domain-containing protein [Deltaproteobacteria bacterium]|nr:helix-turn-helix domain-containing protein [Deltaproteobacteria bacterium]
MGSRRGYISQVRLQIAYQLVQDYGIPLAEVAQQLGVSMSAISKAITRRTKE